MCLFLFWLRLGQIIFALTLFDPTGLEVQGLLNVTFFTINGLAFVTLFIALGAAVAALVFAGGAFALPMLLDRPIGMYEAFATSFWAVRQTFKLSVKRDLSPEQYGLSRQYHTFEGQRSTFMSHLSQRMLELFNKPLDEEVRVLTEIVLDCDATIDQVEGARRFGVNTPTTRSGRSRRR
jgi:hypothetical protein